MKESIATAENLTPRVSALLSALSDYPNVPRKQKKFEVSYTSNITFNKFSSGHVHTLPVQKYLNKLNLCHKWLMTGTQMPLQIYRHNMT